VARFLRVLWVCLYNGPQEEQAGHVLDADNLSASGKLNRQLFLDWQRILEDCVHVAPLWLLLTVSRMSAPTRHPERIPRARDIAADVVFRAAAVSGGRCRGLRAGLHPGRVSLPAVRA